MESENGMEACSTLSPDHKPPTTPESPHRKLLTISLLLKANVIKWRIYQEGNSEPFPLAAVSYAPDKCGLSGGAITAPLHAAAIAESLRAN